MDKVTHVMDIRLAIDFSKLTNPDVISGVKAVLGTREDGIFESYSKLIVDSIISKIIDGRNDHLAILDVELKEVDSTPKVEKTMTEEDISNYMEEILGDNESSAEEEIIAINAVQEDEISKDKEEEMSELFDLYDQLDGEMFKISSYGGSDVVIALPKWAYAKYGVYIESKMEVSVEVMDSTSESEGIEYAITYLDIEGSMKTIKQEKTKKEESK